MKNNDIDTNKTLRIRSLLTMIILVICDFLFFTYSDFILCYLTTGKSIYQCAYGEIALSYLHVFLIFVIVIVVDASLSLYRSIWLYADVDEIARSFIAAIINVALLYAVDKILFIRILGYSSEIRIYAYGILFMLLFMSLLVPRLGYRILRHYLGSFAARYKKSSSDNRIMIVGAGFMGNFIIDDLRHSEYKSGRPVIAVDDNPDKYHNRINNIKIVGNCSQIPELVKRYRINTVIICMPSASKERQKEVIDIAMSADVQVRISPSMSEFLESGGADRKIRNVEITDLLSRPEVTLDKKVCRYLIGTTVLVTGGGGSIGSEICTQVARYTPKKIVIFDIYENTAYELLNRLQKKYGDAIEIFVRIGSVRDKERLREVFEEFKPDVVFHAAAHKHVPLMEDSPCEAIKNNIFGTYNTALIANEYKVSRMVMLSTDKAVNPTNVMGATKRMCEIIIQHMNSISTTTNYAAVRFGNVLGSHGSVIPLFKEQIEEGGPVCVTHPDITRYFMTIPEAAQLVCQAGGLATGGEIFVLDMGEPVKIMDLAKNLIKLSGYTVDEIGIKIIGLRPGEKLYEELAMEEELATRKRTENQKIYVTEPKYIDNDKFDKMIISLKEINNDNVREKLMSFLPNYHPAEN